MLGFKLEFIGCVCNGLHVDHIDRLAERESSLLSAMRCGHRGRNATALPVCNILLPISWLSSRRDIAMTTMCLQAGYGCIYNLP